MNTLKSLVVVIIFNGFLDWILSVAFNFFDIGFEVYGNYMLWFNAVCIFAAILPRKGSELFD
jgi:hypothetical protein|tara:strand:- start:1257 stop:1442 length:186 start_codon:yes stop_codon:yes gene_type:complete